MALPIGDGDDRHERDANRIARLGGCRRLSKDRERGVLLPEAFIELAMIHLGPKDRH